MLLATLWGSSYLLIKVAVAEITPLTLMAARVSLAALVMLLVMRWRQRRLPRDRSLWGALLVQSFFTSIGAWTLLGWGQQHVDSGLASVLNSTSPLFVFLIGTLLFDRRSFRWRQLGGAVLGFVGVVTIIGVDVLDGLGVDGLGQLACLAGAVLYACAALYGRRFRTVDPLAVATGTMIWAVIFLVPAAWLFEQPASLTPSITAMLATVVLSLFCTGLALVLYFRLIASIGSMAVASQAYLRAGIGLLLGVLFLGETLRMESVVGCLGALAGVYLLLGTGTRRW